MGDAPPENRGSQDAQQAPLIARGDSAMSPPAQSTTASGSPPLQLQGEPPSNAFVSQFDMTQPSRNRHSSFNMDPMAAALHHVEYGAPYGPGLQPQQGPDPGVTAAMPAQVVPPQHGLHGMSVPRPPYYPQQGSPMQQYYSIPMYHGHPPSWPLQGRQSVVYAHGQMPPSTHPQAPQGQPPFSYYPTSQYFATPTRPQSQMSNLPGPLPRTQVDPRTAPPPIATGSNGRGTGHVHGRSPKPRTKVEEQASVDGNQSVVRGPPRKPKQRGQCR